MCPFFLLLNSAGLLIVYFNPKVKDRREETSAKDVNSKVDSPVKEPEPCMTDDSSSPVMSCSSLITFCANVLC